MVNLYDDDGPVVGFSGWLNYWRCEARLAGDDGVATGEMEMKDRLVV